MKKTIITFTILLGLFAVNNVEAGTLYPTSEPGETMYSLQDIYDLIVDFKTTEEGNGEELTTPSEVEETQVTLKEIYELILNLKTEETPEVIEAPIEDIIGKFIFSEINTENSNVIVNETASTNNIEIFSGKIEAEGGYFDFSKLIASATVKQDSGAGYAINKVIENVTLKIGDEEVSTSTISPSTNTAVFSGFNKKITSETPIVIEAKIKPLSGNYEEGFSVSITDLTFSVSGITSPYLLDTSKKKTFLFLSN